MKTAQACCAVLRVMFLSLCMPGSWGVAWHSLQTCSQESRALTHCYASTNITQDKGGKAISLPQSSHAC